MKAIRPSDVTYQVLGFLTAPMILLRRAGLLEDPAGQEQAGALAAELAVAAGREDDPLHEVEEVLEVDVLLGDVDELELLGEEAPDEGDADAVGRRPGQLDALRGQDLDPAHAVEDLGQVGVDVLQVLDGRARAVLVDPSLDAVEDVVVGQVGRGDLEGLLGQLEEPVHRFPALGQVGVAEEPVARIRSPLKRWRRSRASVTPRQPR